MIISKPTTELTEGSRLNFISMLHHSTQVVFWISWIDTHSTHRAAPCILLNRSQKYPSSHFLVYNHIRIAIGDIKQTRTARDCKPGSSPDSWEKYRQFGVVAVFIKIWYLLKNKFLYMLQNPGQTKHLGCFQDQSCRGSQVKSFRYCLIFKVFDQPYQHLGFLKIRLESPGALAPRVASVVVSRLVVLEKTKSHPSHLMSHHWLLTLPGFP